MQVNNTINFFKIEKENLIVILLLQYWGGEGELIHKANFKNMKRRNLIDIHVFLMDGTFAPCS